MKKIIPFFIILIIILSITLIFFKNNDKFQKKGNNINTEDELQNYILNINSYEADVEVTVKSNKNINKYKLKQKYSKEGIFKQEVLEPKNIEQTTIIQDGNNLKLLNTKLNVKKIYENYKYLGNNNLGLHYFIRDFIESEDTSTRKEGNLLILETNVKNETKYLAKKILYVDIKTRKPTKMEIKDKTQNSLIYILYNKININCLQKDDILAFLMERNKKTQI